MNTSTTPKVQYGYASGSANTIRPTTITYPDGRVITLSYGASESMNDVLSRIGSIVDDDAGSTHLADYSYLGLGPVGGLLPTVNSPFTPGAVEVDYTEPDIKYTLVGTAGGNDPDTGDIYRGLDRFGRVKDCYWYNYSTSTDVDRIKYGYDRNGNRTYRENTVAATYGKHFDDLYSYDLIDRLKTVYRGSLDSGHSTLDNLQFAQRWGLDATGNWASFLEDSDGNGTWDVDQMRTANPVNEIVGITEDSGPSWVTPAYNRAGNMTTIPKPADPTQALTATYDAWNRLVGLAEGANTVTRYEYDGAKRRTVKTTYVSGELDETRDFYYTDPSRWQVVEERVAGSTTAERQFVWGLRYMDDLILRDRDSTADETLDERLYGMQDANWNVTSVASEVGTVEERYGYHAYGMPLFCTPAFLPRASSEFAWETMFAGYRLDPAVMLFHVRNRAYAATLASWLERDLVPLGLDSATRDAAGLGADRNLYAYVYGKPSDWIDPSGHSDISPIWPKPIPKPPVVFPRPNRPNKKLILGFPICVCPTKKKDRLRPVMPPPAVIPVPPGGPPGGSNSHYPPGTAPIGAGGCGPCIGIVIKCPAGIAVYHFKVGDDAYWELREQSWPPGCQAIICGGDDGQMSNCTADLVRWGAVHAGIAIVGISGSSACGVAPGGGWYVGP